MKKIGFSEAVFQIFQEDKRYHAEAYFFVREALDFASKIVKKPDRGPQKHLVAAELLEGIRQYALREYGPMAITVLDFWGIRRCSDFGQIVFNLVNKNILRRTEGDSIHDFDNGYDFETVFCAPYQPACKRKAAKAQQSLRRPLR
ncbi:MAG: hypothetical protein PHP98_05435 [Kiritimatiellae bacterium]|nr:hypothetical protein [Kiritimatiellia bacterium]